MTEDFDQYYEAVEPGRRERMPGRRRSVFRMLLVLNVEAQERTANGILRSERVKRKI